MNDTQLRIFLSVAEQGSFSRAEQAQYLSKQAMLKHIDALEDEVGCRLFTRSRSGTKLTAAGEVFAQGIRGLLNSRDQLLVQVRSAAGIRNEIRVGNVEHQALLTPVTQAFALQYPEIAIRHTIHPNHSGEWRVENGVQDVAETFWSEYTRLGGYSYTPLKVFPYVAAMRREHRLAGRRSVNLATLSAYPTEIFPIMLGKERTAQVEEAFSSTPGNLIQRMDVDNQVSAAYECLNSDLILITANPFIEGIEELAKISLKEGWRREYGIIYQSPMSPAVKKYVQLAQAFYA